MREFGLLTPSKRSKRCRVSHVVAEAAVGKSDHGSVIIHVAESDTIQKKTANFETSNKSKRGINGQITKFNDLISQSI